MAAYRKWVILEGGIHPSHEKDNKERAGWRRPPRFEVCDVPKGHDAQASSIQSVHAQDGFVVRKVKPPA
jgi:hypothetical protein